MKKNRKWTTLSKKSIYKNPWIKITEHAVIRPDGKKGIYGVIEKSPCVFVVAQDTDGSIFFLKEYRYPVSKEILNLPCGAVESGSIISDAKRELVEETGITAKKWEEIGSAFLAPGFETTYCHIFLATDLDTQNVGFKYQEDKELIREVFKIPINEILKMIKDGKIECMSTLASLCFYLAKKGKF